jgi:hypothetical protein
MVFRFGASKTLSEAKPVLISILSVNWFKPWIPAPDFVAFRTAVIDRGLGCTVPNIAPISMAFVA